MESAGAAVAEERRGDAGSQEKAAEPLHRRRAGSLAAGGFVALLIFLFHLPFAQNSYLVDDSADYLRASRDSFAALYLNTDSASPLSLYRQLGDPAFRAAPWDTLYARGDNAALRHFHSPFSFYVMHLVGAMHGGDGAQRVASSAATAVTCGVLASGLAWLGVPLTVATSLALLSGLHARYTEVSVDPTPHGWYILFAVSFLLFFAAYLRTRAPRTLMLAAVLLGLAFATLEFSLELALSLPFALAAAAWCERWSLRTLKGVLAACLRALPITLLVSFVAWPGGWLRGGYLECYGVTFSTLVFQNHHAFGGKVTPALVYGKLFAGDPALLLLFVFCCAAALILLGSRRLSAESAVLSSYAAVALALGIADHFRLNTYISEFVVFLIAACGLLLRDTLRGIALGALRQASVAAACLVALAAGWFEWSGRGGSMFYRPWLEPVMAGIAAEIPRGESILVNNNRESLYAYLPDYRYEPTMEPNTAAPRTPARAQGIRYYLLQDRTPIPAGLRRLRSFPTYAPGRTLDLYVRNDSH